MKKIGIIFLVIIIYICFSQVFVYAQIVDQEKELVDFKLYAENPFLKLYLNENTTEVAVEDKRNREIWFSNPANRELGVEESQQQRLTSQMTINYYNPDSKRKQMNSYTDSVSYDQYSVSAIEKGVRVDYTIGKEWNEEDFLPELIRKKKFEEDILDKIENESEKDLFEDSFTLISIVKRKEDEEMLNISGNIDEESLLGDYTLISPVEDLDKDEREKRMKALVRRIRNNVDDIEKDSEVQFENLKPYIDNPTYIMKEGLWDWDIDTLIEICQNINFTPAKVQNEYLNFNLTLPLKNKARFEIPIEYTLNKENLNVRIPVDEIKYPQNVLNKKGKMDSYYIYTLELLESFAGAGVDDEGYMFVPDGSGALIKLNNDSDSNKTRYRSYSGQVYGRDEALVPAEEKKAFRKDIHLPVYGIKKGDKALFAIIEEGASMARIRANIAGQVDDYNRIYTGFYLIPLSPLEIENKAEDRRMPGEGSNSPLGINSYASRLFQGDIKIKYKFLYNEKANYAGMADYYRNYLIENNHLKQLEKKDDIPFILDLVGAIEKRKLFWGVPRNVLTSLTTYEQSKEIISSLLQRDINNLKVRFEGMFSGGVRNKFPKDIKLVGEQIKLQQFYEKEGENDIEIFPDINFLHVYKNSLFDNFNPKKYASRRLDYKIAEDQFYQFSSDQKSPEVSYYILSPHYLDFTVDDFLKSYQEKNVSGFSLGKMGTKLNSDFRSKKPGYVDRVQAKDITKKQFNKFKENDLKLMIEGSNSYVLPYANYLRHIPITSSKFNIFDRDIPFLQMVLHGYIDYTGTNINLSEDPQIAFLKTIETGSVPYYKLAYSPSSVVQQTNFDHYFSINYKQWIDHAAEIYQKTNLVYNDLRTKKIIDHKEIEKDLYKTVFENGEAIIVNYNDYEVDINGVNIGSEDFALIKEDYDEKD